MKTNFALALAVVGFLMVVPRLSLAAGEPDAPRLPGNVEFRQWHQGEPPLRLIRKEEGFCALTHVGGSFQGDGEAVRVYVGEDGYWYLDGKSQQSGVEAECVVVRYTAAPAKRVVVLAASYSFGGDYADVTARVKELLRAGKTFQANPGSLLVDPHPYRNKALVIFCKVDGKRAIFSVGEGESVSYDLIVEKARVTKDQARKHAGAHRTKIQPAGSESSDETTPAPAAL